MKWSKDRLSYKKLIGLVAIILAGCEQLGETDPKGSEPERGSPETCEDLASLGPEDAFRRQSRGELADRTAHFYCLTVEEETELERSSLRANAESGGRWQSRLR